MRGGFDDRLVVYVHDDGMGLARRPDSPGLGLGLCPWPTKATPSRSASGPTAARRSCCTSCSDAHPRRSDRRGRRSFRRHRPPGRDRSALGTPHLLAQASHLPRDRRRAALRPVSGSSLAPQNHSETRSGRGGLADGLQCPGRDAYARTPRSTPRALRRSGRTQLFHMTIPASLGPTSS